MNTKRILNWSIFIVVIGLIIWEMVAASNKAERENMGVSEVDKISSSDWVRGATTSPIILVEYSDFQCPACAAYMPIVEEFIQKNPEIAFVYRHFPLPQHGNAIQASITAEAAGKQGKFWEMYRIIFENQLNWQDSKTAKTIFESYAKELSLDIEKYNKDIESESILQKITNDTKSGLKAGVNSTPSFFVNGKKINVPNNYEQFKKLVEDTAKSTINP